MGLFSIPLGLNTVPRGQTAAPVSKAMSLPQLFWEGCSARSSWELVGGDLVAVMSCHHQSWSSIGMDVSCGTGCPDCLGLQRGGSWFCPAKGSLVQGHFSWRKSPCSSLSFLSAGLGISGTWKQKQDGNDCFSMAGEGLSY